MDSGAPPGGHEVDPPARASGDGSPERLVAAAVDLALEHHETGVGLRDVFGYLTPGAVAARAGLSRGLIYHHWGGPDSDGSEAFTRFLTAVSDELWRRSAVPQDLDAMVELLPDDFDEVILALTAFEVDRYSGRDRALFRASQALTVNGARPVDEAETVVRDMSVLYEKLGEKLGLEPVPPLTYEDVTLAVMCAFEGFSLYENVLFERTVRSVARPSSSDGAARDWPLVAIAVEGIVRNMTRPAAGGAGDGPATGPGSTTSEEALPPGP